ncbi:MAG: DUF934 domain-containing protein [Pseudomonadota bacterium]
MSVIVTDTGFGPDVFVENGGQFVSASDLALTSATRLGVDLFNDADPGALVDHFERIALIRIPFPSFADGRGFSLARQLRGLGYTGRLRASGHLISDQYKHARKVGFDEVEIDFDLATRQPEPHWLRAAAPGYLEKFRSSRKAA